MAGNKSQCAVYRVEDFAVLKRGRRANGVLKNQSPVGWYRKAPYNIDKVNSKAALEDAIPGL